MSAPLLSIIITNRNYGVYVVSAVSSALAQDGAEVVVVDDGSDDDSLERLAPFADRITLVSQANGGQAAAMNAGVARCTAPITLFLDADDVLAPDIGARIRPHFDDPAVARVHFPLRRVDASGAPLGGTVPPDPSTLPAGDLRDRVLRHPHDLAWQPTSGNAYRRSVLDVVMPVPEAPYRTCADHHLNALSALHGRVAVEPAVGGDYRLHGQNVDARDEFDLRRVQGIVKRSRHTEVALADHARTLGFRGVRPRSVSVCANRILSLRLGADAHPVPDDSVVRAVRDGLHASAARTDLRGRRRLAAAGFVLALAVAPRRTLPALAVRHLTGATDALSSTSSGA